MTAAPPALWQPDSPLVSALYPSPNIEPRRSGVSPSILLLHYTGLPSASRAIDVLSREDCKVSCHYVVDLDGRVTQMVAEAARAWHAGVSSWAGETDINSASIGIEIQNEGHTAGCPPYPPAQMAAVRDLSRDILARHPAIQPARVLAHSDVAPGRKIDPGEWFDWPWLASNGVGLWVEPAPVDAIDPGFGRDDCTPLASQAVQRLQSLLAVYGYGIQPSGAFDEATEKVVKAFQRHYRPARVDGRIDASTLATAQRLVATAALA
jgi:N-acetylmuramoyl-L-alanine amidase